MKKRISIIPLALIFSHLALVVFAASNINPPLSILSINLELVRAFSFATYGILLVVAIAHLAHRYTKNWGQIAFLGALVFIVESTLAIYAMPLF